jgi:para-nitrobenzyl esterase
MTDERYVVRTERLAEAQGRHAPVWRSRYDGPYSGLDDDPDPAFKQYAPQLIAAHGGDAVGIWQGGSDLSDALHTAWGAFATTGVPGWAPYAQAPDQQATWPAMIFAPDGPRIKPEPFVATNAIWSGLTWQPGPWWTTDGVI